MKLMTTKNLVFPLLVLTLNAHGQFDKYKSKTDFKITPPTPSAVENQKSEPDDENDESNDIFGRSAGLSNKNLPKKDSKYVNLNPETAFGPEVVETFDFPNTSLSDLTKHMQKLTGINIILDKELKGKVSIMAPSAITVGDAWKAYLTALNMNGLTLVKSGAFYKVVQSRDIRYTPTKIYTGAYTPDTENYVMRIIPLKNINATEVSRSFRPFMSRYGRILDIKQTNTIIVQDTGSNINRLVQLIKFIDVPGHEETLQIMKVSHSSAQEIAKLLEKILKGSESSKFKTNKEQGNESISKLTAEPRTNAIIAMANASGAKRLRELIAKLDVPIIARNSGLVHVYYLFHSDSETLSKTLSQLVSGAKTSSQTSRFSKRISGDFDSGGSGTNSLFSADVKVTADKDNNAIVVTASPTDWLTLEQVIKKLDIPRDQVYVEGLIMETNISKNRGFGVSLVGAYGKGSADRAGINSGDVLSLIGGQFASLGSFFVGGGVGSTVKVPLGSGEVEVKSVNGLITAIANSGNADVLATPQLLVLDNTEGVFEVGEQIPTVEKTDAANGSSTFARKQQKVSLSLKITPQINKVTRFIKLKIDQKVEDFSNRRLPDGLANEGVATNIRSALTTVVVRDRDTIAMGGLMRDRETQTESKVPLLGDIPVLGWLFKTQRSTVEKVNLLFFLTPKILSNYQQANAENTQELLNRRSHHLKDIHGEDDPFQSTVKGLYDKAGKQKSGPLYDRDEAEKYKRRNEEKGIGSPAFEEGSEEDDDENSFSKILEPNYKSIIDKVGNKRAAITK